MKTIFLSFAVAFALSSFAFADKGKNKDLDYSNSKEFKEFLNMPKEEKEKQQLNLRKNRYECEIRCLNGEVGIYIVGTNNRLDKPQDVSMEKCHTLKKSNFETCGK